MSIEPNVHRDDDLSTKLPLFGACEMESGQIGIITGRKASNYGGIITAYKTDPSDIDFRTGIQD